VDFSDYVSLGRDYDVPLPIILEVTDGAGNTSSTAVHFYFAEPLEIHNLYLPLVLKSE